MKIAVCDDEENYVTRFLGKMLKRALETVNVTAEVSFFTDGNQLIKKFMNDQIYDIVILDIDMPAINGKKLAAELRIINSAFCLIFISSYKAEVFNTLQYHVDSFIPKDSRDEFFMSELVRVIHESGEKNHQYHLFKIKDEHENIIMKKIPVQNIFCICCRMRKCYLYTGKDEYVLWGIQFESLLKKYIPLGFFEVARGYIVNLRHVLEVREIDTVLDNNVVIQVSRRRRKLFLDAVSDMIMLEVEKDGT